MTLNGITENRHDIIAGEKMITLAFKCASNHFWLTGRPEVTRIFCTWEFAGVQYRMQDLGACMKNKSLQKYFRYGILHHSLTSLLFYFRRNSKSWNLFLIIITSWTHQKCTKHIKTDKVNDGKIASTRVFFPWIIIRFGITAFSRQTCQHDFLPSFSSCTPLIKSQREMKY